MKFADRARSLVAKNGPMAFYNACALTDKPKLKQAALLVALGFIDTASYILDVDDNDETY